MSKLEQLINELCPNGVEWKTLENYIDIYTGSQFNKRDMKLTGLYPVINGGVNASGYAEIYNEEANTITVSQGGASAGYVNWMKSRFYAGAHCYIVKPKDSLSNRYLYHFLKSIQTALMNSQHGAGIPALNRNIIKSTSIPLPPLPVQEEIVRILDAFTDYTAELQAELQARREQYEYYRNKLLSFEEDSSVEWKKLGEICEFINGRAYKQDELLSEGKYKVLRVGNFFTNDKWYYSDLELEDKKYCYPGDLLYAWSASFGPSIWNGPKTIFHYHIWKILCNEEFIDQKYLYHWLKSDKMLTQLSDTTHGATMSHLTKATMEQLQIVLPPLSEQRRIVSILDKFEALVNDLTEGLPAEIAARQEQYEYYRDRLLSFPKAV